MTTIRQFTRRVLRQLAPDPQTRLPLNLAAAGAQDARLGLATAWDRWMRPFAGRQEDIPQPVGCPSVDPDAGDPIATILDSPNFGEFAGFFDVPSADEPALVSAYTQGLLYALVRHLRPEHVVEIGSYRLSTSKVICRALHANGCGMLHTVDPNDGAAIVGLLRRWPAQLREHVCYYPVSSMEFFTSAAKLDLKSDLIFIDGNHDYEYALFDILSAARLVNPRGFVVIDNISQGGPLHAAYDFMREHAGWSECGRSLNAPPSARAFDPERSAIAGTDLCILRAPARYHFGQRPQTIGAQWVDKEHVGGIELAIAHRASGTLHAQYVVRVIKPQTRETTTEVSVELHDAVGPTRVELPWRFEPDELGLMRSVELWLGWSGDEELELSKPPVLY